MNYTNNYHLPQWEKTDRVLMDDFNQAMSRLEEGLNGAVQHGSDAADAARSAASQLASQAQATANNAVNKANAAQATADRAFHPAYLPYQAGSYRGNGSTTSIHVGFRPSMVLIHHSERGTLMTSIDLPVLKLTSTGMDVIYAADSKPYASVNASGAFYDYIAFR